MFRLQVTITKQTFQYMDMTCSVPQYGIPYCLHQLFIISNIETINCSVFNISSEIIYEPIKLGLSFEIQDA
jgi:hypothetical protein